MKKVVFLVSHLGSGSNLLSNILDNNPRIQGFRTGKSYVNFHSLESLTDQPHKLDNTAAIYMDELNFNYNLASKSLYSSCKFIYFIREARGSLEDLILNYKYYPAAAMRYYCYRLRRICEMSKNTPDAILLTWDNLHKKEGMELIEEYLNLRERLIVPDMSSIITKTVPLEIVEKSQNAYERYLYFLKKQKLNYPNKNSSSLS